jgi:CTP synthase
MLVFVKMKHIFVTGGVVSSLGKGIATASIGALLRARGYTVAAVKIDPYINVDAGTMRPYEHGEVFVTKDGAETDLDLGHYERFLDIDHLASNSVTTGKVYLSVIQKERRGDYLSKTVQVIPHITDEIKAMIQAAAEAQKAEIVVVEVGGTVGDIESLPFLEAIRQFRFDQPTEDTLYVHLTLVPRLGTTGELKTKPTQHSVATLRGVGIQPDIILVRSEEPIPEETRKKIALFTNVRAEDVFSSYDVDDIYQVPLVLEEQGLGKTVEKKLGLEATFPNLTVWQEIVSALSYPERVVQIGIAGKYIRMPDAYLSMLEALKHGGIPHKTRVEIRWIDSEELNYKDAPELLAGLDGILVPGGFGVRGVEGKIVAAGYARSHKIPYLGLCLGLQIAVVEFARNVAGLANANSREFDPYTAHPVIDLMPEQQGLEEMGGTMRLGDWPMEILEGSHLHRIYGKTRAFERHRHRYEVNPDYVETLSQAGLVISGTTPGMDGHGQGLVEAIELSDHPFFLASQFHPEFKSRPMRPAPLFVAFVAAALAYSDHTKTYADSSLPQG